MQTRYFSAALTLAALCAMPLAAPTASLAAGTMDNPETVDFDADYAAGKRAIDGKSWEAAIRSLTPAAARHPDNADIQNFLGYANRKLGNFDLAFKYYNRALELNPKHRGAHEYIGVAYLQTGNLAKAEEHLAALDKICFLRCEEYNDLKRAVASYKEHNGKLPSGN